jgi:hypothetical protein
MMAEYGALLSGDVWLDLKHLLDVAWQFLFSWKGLVALAVVFVLYALLRRR